MADITAEIDLDSVIDRLLEGELAFTGSSLLFFFFSFFFSMLVGQQWRSDSSFSFFLTFLFFCWGPGDDLL